MTVFLGGCASLIDSNEAIIRVQSRQDPAKAGRLTLQGVKAMQNGEIDRAVSRFTAAINADPSYGPAHNNLGLLHYEQGNLFQAVLAFEQALELMPEDPIVYYNLGLTLEAAGRTHEALDLYWQAVEMAPTNPNFLGNLVRLRIRLGEQGPEISAQLKDLVLIETRADWRRWADQQLAYDLNDALDRGPETPDFNSNQKSDKTKTDGVRDNIIDLTPRLSDKESRSSGGASASIGEMILTEPTEPTVPDRADSFLEMEASRPEVRSRPIPIQNQGSLRELPPSIDEPTSLDFDDPPF